MLDKTPEFEYPTLRLKYVTYLRNLRKLILKYLRRTTFVVLRTFVGLILFAVVVFAASVRFAFRTCRKLIR